MGSPVPAIETKSRRAWESLGQCVRIPQLPQNSIYPDETIISSPRSATTRLVDTVHPDYCSDDVCDALQESFFEYILWVLFSLLWFTKESQ